jgi:hypothetical protein
MSVGQAGREMHVAHAGKEVGARLSVPCEMSSFKQTRDRLRVSTSSVLLARERGSHLHTRQLNNLQDGENVV